MITRRGSLRLASLALVGLGVRLCSSDPSGRWGAVTIKRHRELCAAGVHLHVWHNNEDVTRRCWFADDTCDGVAELYKLDSQGKKYIDRSKNDAAKETVRGVVFMEGTAFS